MNKSRISKFLSLASTEKLLVLNALLWLQINWLLVSLMPLAKIIRLYRGVNPRINTTIPKERIPELVESSSRITPWTDNCLIRGLTSLKILRATGIEARLAVGVRKNNENSLQAHAWLENSDGSTLSEERLNNSDYEKFKDGLFSIN